MNIFKRITPIILCICIVICFCITVFIKEGKRIASTPRNEDSNIYIYEDTISFKSLNPSKSLFYTYNITDKQLTKTRSQPDYPTNNGNLSKVNDYYLTEPYKFTRHEEYLLKIFSIMKMMENITLMDRKTCLNDSELRMLGEIFAAKREGKRLISTQLADRLNVTRSAVSQMVNKLEKGGIVKRVADDVDRKIAYIEASEDIEEKYQQTMKMYTAFTGKVIKKYGAEKFQILCDMVDEFFQVFEEEKKSFEIQPNKK